MRKQTPQEIDAMIKRLTPVFCPVCTKPAYAKSELTGEYECRQEHTWTITPTGKTNNVMTKIELPSQREDW